MPNGNICKIGLTIPVDGCEELHIKRDSETQGNRAAIAIIVDHLRKLADLIEAQSTDSGSVFDEHGRFLGRFEYRA
jgi:hypothetical protein